MFQQHDGPNTRAVGRLRRPSRVLMVQDKVTAPVMRWFHAASTHAASAAAPCSELCGHDVPDNCATIYIPGDRWSKRATHILPPCLLETTLRPAPPIQSITPERRVSHAAATGHNAECLRSASPSAVYRFYHSILPIRRLSHMMRCRKKRHKQQKQCVRGVWTDGVAHQSTRVRD